MSWGRSSPMDALSDPRSQFLLVSIIESSTHKSLKHNGAVRSLIGLDTKMVHRRVDRCDRHESCDMRGLPFLNTMCFLHALGLSDAPRCYHASIQNNSSILYILTALCNRPWSESPHTRTSSTTQPLTTLKSHLPVRQ